ncbi:MFS family permease [Allocatelliglobosispora scoriae]|uniref:MFS family permease n=1 Tax=Allocatelliglobosispora scoriae TaxID=643052 RepID=A0A841BV68_9ACTN|nr:MFS transporter [Allocatelliglobosispora scoriae]MBB5871348.1 MFS family permease [Allocatelliglobosispora scoriae]
MSRRFAMDLSPLKRYRDFRLLFIALSVSSFGSFITYITIPFQVAKITDNPLMVGLIGVCELVPLLFMAFVGGALADYVDRRILVVGGEIAQMAMTGFLLLNAILGKPQLWLLFVVAALSAAIDGLQRPALEGLTPRLVPMEDIPAASALNSFRMQIASLGAPAAAGLLIAVFGAGPGLGWVYGIDLATFAVGLACLALMKAVPPPEAADRPSLRSVMTGLRYAKNRPELMGTYLVDINAMFFGMPQALYPFFAQKLGGPAVLGLLYAAPSAGSMLATLTSGWTKRIHRHGLAVIIAAGLWGVGIIVFGLSHSLWLAIVGLLLAGAADMISGIFRSTIWNQTIPDHLRGRLAGIEMISYTTGPLLGGVRSGGMARFVGIGGSVVWGGVLCIIGTVALAAALPKFLAYDGRDGILRKQEEEAARAELVATQ